MRCKALTDRHERNLKINVHALPISCIVCTTIGPDKEFDQENLCKNQSYSEMTSI